MSENFQYSLIKNQEGNFAVQSVVRSFNLDHVTEKDIVSFYNNFSNFASFDTGLLPLDGTGVLAIRTAGPHTQIVAQHAPGLYHINWGAHEGDASARTYYVAQPYRIIIGDFENGNLLGARMFYSPYPITSPENILYHVNLPNINCRGYRGNGVGWICLYHKDDWSSFPFNEKVSRFIERCSGVETYNDANMSETDGPRFYAMKSKPGYLSSPSLWQKKSEEEGFQWTLDENLWIPVLVQDLDNQDKHYDNGQPLTLAMAMLGNYQAYYTDRSIPKMFNIISRSDMSLSNKNVADFFKMSFAASPAKYSYQNKDNPYAFTTQHRQEKGSPLLVQPSLFSNDDDDDEDEDIWLCNCCENSLSEDYDKYEVMDGSVCESCFNEYYVYIESVNQHYHVDNDSIFSDSSSGAYYHYQYDAYFECIHCDSLFAVSGKSIDSINELNKKIYFDQSSNTVCSACYDDFVVEEDLSTGNCYACHKSVVTSTGWNHVYPSIKAMVTSSESPELTPGYVTFCSHCASKHFVCPCGIIKDSSTQMAHCEPTPIDSFNSDVQLTVTSCCAECLGNVTESSDGIMVANYQPQSDFHVELVKKVAQTGIYQNVSQISVQIINDQDIF